jgi:hypothetical protein
MRMRRASAATSVDLIRVFIVAESSADRDRHIEITDRPGW